MCRGKILPFLTVPCERCKCRSKSIGRRDAFSCVCSDLLPTICPRRTQRSSPSFPAPCLSRVPSNASGTLSRWCTRTSITSTDTPPFHICAFKGTISRNYLARPKDKLNANKLHGVFSINFISILYSTFSYIRVHTRTASTLFFTRTEFF